MRNLPTYTPSFRSRLVILGVVAAGLLALIWVAGWVAGPPLLSAVPVQGGWEVPGPPLPSGRHVNDGSTADALESVVRDGLTASGTHLLPGGPIQPTDILAYPNAWVLFQQRLVLPGAPSADPVSEVTMPMGAYFATGSTRVGVTFGTNPGVTYAYDLDPAAMARLGDLIYPTGETPVFVVGWAIIALVGVAAAAAVVRGWRLDRARRARSP